MLTKNNKYLLWLDDYRNPFIDYEGRVPKNEEFDGIIWVLNYSEFTRYILYNGVPHVISFDHDLADEHYDTSKPISEYREKTGNDCLRWLIEYCMNNKILLPKIYFHTANPVGKENMQSVLNSYNKHISQKHGDKLSYEERVKIFYDKYVIPNKTYDDLILEMKDIDLNCFVYEGKFISIPYLR